MWIPPYPPEPTVLRDGNQWNEPITGYTREQLVEYGKRCAQSAREVEREACARVCAAADKSAHPADLADAILSAPPR